jgi:hypothetical protein
MWWVWLHSSYLVSKSIVLNFLKGRQSSSEIGCDFMSTNVCSTDMDIYIYISYVKYFWCRIEMKGYFCPCNVMTPSSCDDYGPETNTGKKTWRIEVDSRVKGARMFKISSSVHRFEPRGLQICIFLSRNKERYSQKWKKMIIVFLTSILMVKNISTWNVNKRNTENS